MPPVVTGPGSALRSWACRSSASALMATPSRLKWPTWPAAWGIGSRRSPFTSRSPMGKLQNVLPHPARSRRPGLADAGRVPQAEAGSLSFSPGATLLTRLPPDATRPHTVQRANFGHLYGDIFWFGILAGSAMAFLNIYAVRLGASALQIGLLTPGRRWSTCSSPCPLPAGSRSVPWSALPSGRLSCSAWGMPP